LALALALALAFAFAFALALALALASLRQFLKEIVILSEAKNLLLARAASARSCL
jgi:hypothetical protein